MSARVLLERVEDTGTLWWIPGEGPPERLDPTGSSGWGWGARTAAVRVTAAAIASRVVAELDLPAGVLVERCTELVEDRLVMLPGCSPVVGFEVLDIVAGLVTDPDGFGAAAGFHPVVGGWQRYRPGLRSVTRLVPVSRLRPFVDAMFDDLDRFGISPAERGIEPVEDRWGRFPVGERVPAALGAYWCHIVGLHPLQVWDDPFDRAAVVWAWPPSRWGDRIDDLEHRRLG